MAKNQPGRKAVHLDETIQGCRALPMAAGPPPSDSKEPAALAACTAALQKTFKLNRSSLINPQETLMKTIKAAILIAAASLASIAMAGEIKPFSQAEFDKLSHEGKPVVLDISATWCPTCKAQKPIVEGLMKQSAYRDVTLMTLDFDADKPTLKKFKVTMQSTLVAFKGDKEVARSTGDTTPAGLEALVKKTVN